MLHHAEPRHGELRLELGERTAVTLEEPVEKQPSRRIGEGTEDKVVVVYARG